MLSAPFENVNSTSVGVFAVWLGKDHCKTGQIIEHTLLAEMAFLSFPSG